MVLPWFLCGVLTTVVLALLVKIRRLHTSLDEIGTQLGERLSQDTNTLISLSSGDRHARRLAAELNRQLRLLRRQRRQYLQGDRELKEAVTNISHDLRTPLTAICGYLELLEREDKSEAAARYLATIGDRAQALRQLTEELLRYAVILSTREDLPLDEVRLNGALEESVARVLCRADRAGDYAGHPDNGKTDHPPAEPRSPVPGIQQPVKQRAGLQRRRSGGRLDGRRRGRLYEHGGRAGRSPGGAAIRSLLLCGGGAKFHGAGAGHFQDAGGTDERDDPGMYADGKLHIAVAFPDGAKGKA